MSYGVIILAAGKGTRMKSRKPKVLQRLAGKPLLGHILSTVDELQVSHKLIVVGYGKEQVIAAFSDNELEFIEQKELLGTGHAVQQCLPKLQSDLTYLILVGDAPLVSSETLAYLCNAAKPSGIAVLTVALSDASGYGRIVRNELGQISRIVEQKDASNAELSINEINSGMFAVRGDLLKSLLPKLTNDNRQGEYYLTDIVSHAKKVGIGVASFELHRYEEIAACNDRTQLAELESIYRQRQAKKLLKQGVTLIDPNRIDVRGDLTVGRDVEIDINCVFIGQVTLEDNVTIAPNCILKDVHIGANTIIYANSMVESSAVGKYAQIGPFARIRPNTKIADKVKIGNFVELKNAQFAVGAKASHLSYVGDAIVGEEANIGAGTITCNYDGANKHITSIGKNAFIGSNSALVAPVEIGNNAVVGAGSTITKSVSENALGIARSKQAEIKKWQRPIKKKT